MKLSNDGGNRVPTDHHSPPSEVSNPAIGLQLVQLLSKEAPQESPNYPSYCQDYKLFCTI